MVVGCLFILFAVGFYFGAEYLSASSGNAAKTICSAIHTGNKPADFIETQEIGSQQFPIFASKINGNDVTVTTSILGLFKRTARYYPNIQSCVLLPANEDKTIWDGSNYQRKSSKSTGVWPQGDNEANNNKHAKVNYDLLNLLLEAAFHEPVVEGIGIVRKTRAVIVIYDGKIIAERYASPYDQNTRFPGYELTKPLFGTLLGKQISDSKLKLDDQNLLSSWTDSRSKITIRQLLTGLFSFLIFFNYFYLNFFLLFFFY